MEESGMFDLGWCVGDQESEEEVFETGIHFSLNDEHKNSQELYSVGSFKHKLFYLASDIDDRTRHGHDILCDFVQQKYDFERVLKLKTAALSKKNAIETLSNLETQIKAMRKDMCLRIPYFIPHYTQSLRKDPDHAFRGNYNWYYTGGCLQHVDSEQKHYLLFVDGKKRDNLCIAPLKSDPFWNVDKLATQSVVPQAGKQIYQVIKVESSSSTLIGTRQRHKCQVYCLQHSHTKPLLKKCFNVDIDGGFVSFDLSGVYKELCTINNNNGLSFWDISQKEEPMTIYFPSDNPKHEKWHSLWYSANPSVVTVAGRKSCKWIDRRTTGPNNSLQLSSFRDICEDEQISLHFPSEQSPYLMYVGTNINLFLTDIRLQKSYVRRWSHRLKFPPLYSCVTTLHDGKEIACIGNHSPGNVILAFSNDTESHPLLQMPSRLNTLLSYQSCGLCLDPSIEPRMTCSLTGMTFLKNTKFSDIELLTQTIASDIFSQALFERTADRDSCNLKNLASKKDTLNLSHKWDMTNVYKILSNKKLKFPVNSSKPKKQAWQIQKEEMIQYKDALAPIILAEWDVDTIECEKKAVSNEQKVNAWLESNSFQTFDVFLQEKDLFSQEG